MVRLLFGADADPELVARMIGRNVNQHYGQTCSTIHRVFVERSVFDDFLQASESFFKELVIGNQAEKGTQLGPVINSRQPQRILEGIAFAKAKGADAILEGGHASVSGYDGYYLKPTLLRSPAGSNCNPLRFFMPSSMYSLSIRLNKHCSLRTTRFMA